MGLVSLQPCDRVLERGRICQELEAQLLDSWQDYSLLKIDNIYVLLSNG